MDEHQRQRRRAFIRDHHPDRGGDPTAFVAGLAAFDDPPPEVRSTADVPVRIFVVADGPWPRSVVTQAIRWFRRRNAPPRVK